MIACFSFAHNQESLGMAPLCRFGSPYRFRQAMSFSWLKPNVRQNQLSRSPLRCFQWLMKSTIWSRTEAGTHCTFNFSPQSFFLTQYVRSATQQSPRLFEIILILGYQLRVDDCVPAEQCLWKTHELNRKRPVSAIHNIDLDVFLDSHIPGILGLHPGREPRLRRE